MKGKKLNVGIQILRMLFSFHILVFHCINKKLYSNKIINFIIGNVEIDLTVFFIISFYYSNHTFISKNIVKIKQRFYRLLIPFIIWPLIFFITHNLSYYLNGEKNYFKSYLLYYQFLVGNGINIVFWFQCHLIILSILFLIVIFASNRKSFIVLTIIGVSSHIFISSNYYKKHFSYDTILIYSVRKLPFSYIYSLYGFILFNLNGFLNFKKYKIKIFFIFLIVFCLYIYHRVFLELTAYFLMIKSVLGISLFIVFLNLPLHETNNNLINHLASYSGGIYYLHTRMQILLPLLLKRKKSKTIIACIINYLLCYLFCLIGSKLFKESNLRYLFL